MEESPASSIAPEFDVYGAMDWSDGVGTLPGSELKFRVNEFGVLEVITDEAEAECVKKAHATTTWAVPTAQEVFSATTATTTGKRDHLELPWARPGLVCARCQRKGSPSDFLPDGRYCSERCLRQDQQEEVTTAKEAPGSNGHAATVGRKRCAQVHGSIEEEADTLAEAHDDDEDYEEKADRKTMRVPNRGRRKRRGDAALLRHIVPCGGKKKTWCWASYLEQEKAIAAPIKLFKEHQSFPQSKNGFRVGMKLEGVDPEHPSMYCVLTVMEVSGHRIRLHFDKFSDCYDFWMNSNSPDIHPVGWCEKTGHKLHPPKGMKDEEFSWPSYLKQCKAQAAPKALFENQNTTVTPSGFRIGMKLEAVSKKNPTFICVATVTDMVDNRFLVHFDSWDESYDYWCDATSPYIHPVDWCQKNTKTLTAPPAEAHVQDDSYRMINVEWLEDALRLTLLMTGHFGDALPGYHNAKNFSWEKYLEETNSLPAPARAFKVKPPHSFQKHMKLEAVDKRNPMLIRVCTVADTDDHRTLIHFDGWTDEYNYWVDADSADIHPAGWCAKTGHPLQPPISPQEAQSVCPTPGCKGVGHIKGARYSGHHSAVGCPYSDINVNKDPVLPDRLSGEMPTVGPTVARTRRGESIPDIASFTSNKHSAGSPHNLGEPLGVKNTDSSSVEAVPKKTVAVETKRSTLDTAEGKRLKFKKDTGGVIYGKKSENWNHRKHRVGRPCKQRKVEEVQEVQDMQGEEEAESEVSSIVETKDLSLQQALHQSVFMPCTSPSPNAPLCWDQHSKLLPTVAGITASKVAEWSVEQVTHFIQGLPGCKEHVRMFREEQIDGEAFLLLTQVDLVKIMSIKLGPALKIYNSILMFKTAEDSYNEL